MVCSNWADNDLSLVTAVQPSLRILIFQSPILIMGSMVKNIPVFSSDKIYEEQPNYLIILAWNFAQSIMKAQQKYSDQGGLFILPMPKPSIVKI